MEDYARHFKAARDILHSRMVGPIVVSKALQEIYPTDAQVEENDEGRLDMLFDVDRVIEVDERMSPHVCSENADKASLETL